MTSAERKKVLQFVNSAVSDDKTRDFMRAPYWDEGKLVATDGKRLHIWTPAPKDREALGLDEIPSGSFVYILAKEGRVVQDKSERNSFPNYKRVIPEYPAERHRPVDITESGIVLFCLHLQVAINHKYLVPLAKLSGRWNVSVAEGEDYNMKSIRFDCLETEHEVQACIMPMQFYKEDLLY